MATAAATVDVEKLEMLKKDARYQKGVKEMRENKVEDAIDSFAELLEETVSRSGDLCAESAIVYYQYGHALLTRAEVFNENKQTNKQTKEHILLALLIVKVALLCSLWNV